MAQIPSDELVIAQEDLSAKAFGLLMYYYSKGSNWEWIDEVMAKDLHMTVRKIKEYRRELINNNYLLVFNGKISNVFIGRQAVMDFKSPVELDTEVEAQ